MPVMSKGVIVQRPKAADEDLSGTNTAVGTSFVDILQLNAVIVLPTSAAVVVTTCSSVQDKGTATAGTGIRTLRLRGLDANFEEITEDIITDGGTPVNSTKTFMRLLSATALTTGSSLAAVGTITFSIGGNNQLRIAIGLNKTESSQFTVPAGKRVFMDRFFINQFDGKTLDMRLQYKEIEGSNLWINIRQLKCTDFQIPVDINREFGEKIDFRWQGKVSTGSGQVTAGYELIYV